MDKELLFKDLSSRLPYGVKVAEFDEKGRKISNKYTLVWIENDYSVYGNLKPYLFPMSSMTKEQRKEYYKMIKYNVTSKDNANLLDWLNSNHFDYRGLIEKEMAIDCTNLNIY